jgi:hypothetical protein
MIKTKNKVTINRQNEQDFVFAEIKKIDISNTNKSYIVTAKEFVEKEITETTEGEEVTYKVRQNLAEQPQPFGLSASDAAGLRAYCITKLKFSPTDPDFDFKVAEIGHLLQNNKSNVRGSQWEIV